MRILTTALGVLIVAAGVCNAAPAPLNLQDRWVYYEGNLTTDASVQTTVALAERAAKDGYNGLVVAADFVKWDTLGPSETAANARKVRDACRRIGMKFIPCLFDVGMAQNGVLANDPNLAEGLPVMNAPFVVRNRALVPAEDPARILNGSFEEHNGDEPANWVADMPGKTSFVDTDVKYEGKPSLRMQDIGASGQRRGGRCSIRQPLKLRPFSYYHLSMAVKTQDFESAEQRTVYIDIDAPKEVNLNYYEPPVLKNQDWTRVDITFNSLEFSEATLNLLVRGGKGGKIWWSDVRIEPAGLVNVLRRDGTPLRVTSEDGKTTYKEGQDFGVVRDPLLGVHAYTVWHEPPVVPVPEGSALKEGQKVLLSYYYPPKIYRWQVNACMAEPKIYDLFKREAEIVKSLEPDGYFMLHDEIRCQGWDEDCVGMKMTAGQILAYNVKRCVEILNTLDPGKPLYVWQDMFDPYHNAKPTGRYYLVKGDGPWTGSWEGLPKEVTMITWHGHEPGRLDSLKFFAARGHKQILAGYYDADSARIRPWLAEAATVEGVVGAMYTTWQDNYTELEKFAQEIGSPSVNPAAGAR